MQLHDLEKRKSHRKSSQVGRGGKRGKTSGRGHKGQKARAGHKIRPAIRDLIKKLPKLRGFGKNRARTVNPDRERPQVVNLSLLNDNFNKGQEVNPQTLLEKGLVKKYRGRLPKVKILAGGEISKDLKVSNCTASEGAREKIKKAGGKIV